MAIIISFTYILRFKRKIWEVIKKIVRTGTPKEIFWDMESLDRAMLKQPYVSRVCRALGIEGDVISIEDAVKAIRDRG